MGKSSGRGIDQTCIVLPRQPAKDDHPAIKVVDQQRAQGLVSRSGRSGFFCCLDVIVSGFVIWSPFRIGLPKASFAIHIS